MRIFVYRCCLSPSSLAKMRKQRLWTIIITVGIIIYLYYTTFPSRPEVTTHKQPYLQKRFKETNVSVEVNKRAKWSRSFLCSLQQHPAAEDAGNEHHLQKLLRDIVPKKENANVFLIDTACNNHPKFRAWCSVESWAQQNPKLDIWFVMTSPTVNDFDRLPSKLLQEYPNLNIVGTYVDNMFEGTPLLRLFESMEWAQNNTWPVELLSDMLRVLVLWHWGGVYSDTDVLTIRPFSLSLNSLGYETVFQIGSAVYSFKAHHHVLWRLMEDMVNGFEPELWGSIGPKAITRVMKAECGVEDLQQLLPKTPVTCGEITLHDRATFYPVDYTQSKKFFTQNRGKKFRRTFRNSYAIHFWNKMSKNFAVRKGDNSLYEVAAKKFCPITYNKAMEEGSTF